MDDELRTMLVQLMEGQETLKIDISKIAAKIDGDLITTQQGLLDGYKQNYEAITDIKTAVDYMKQDTECLKDSISEIKDDINYIAGKTIKNDSKINKLAQELKAAR